MDLRLRWEIRVDLNRFLRNLGFLSFCPIPLSVPKMIVLQDQTPQPSAAGVGLIQSGSSGREDTGAPLQ